MGISIEKSLVCALAGFALTASTWAAAPATAPVDSAAVAKLLGQLSDEDGATRSAAAKSLEAMGPGIKPEVAKFLAGSVDRKTRARAEAVLANIGEAAQGATEGTAVTFSTEPIPITLNLTDANPADAFDALFAQAQGTYSTQPPDLLKNTDDMPPITINVEKGDFWSVLKQLCEQTGVSPQQGYSNQEQGMVFTKGGDSNWTKYPSVTTKGFLIMVRSIGYNKSIDLARPDDARDNLSLQFMAYPEPNLQVVQANYQVGLDEAVDDEGNSLLRQERNSSGYSSGRQGVWQFQSSLDASAALGNKIDHLKGSVKFGVQAEMVKIEIPDVLNAKKVVKTAGDVKLTLEEIKKESNDRYIAKIVVARPRNADSNNLNVQSIQLLDAEGKPLDNQGYGGGGGGNGEYTYTMNFGRNERYGRNGREGKPGVPAKLVWEVPTKITEITVPFEFKDLPLP
jgi:hypothetical protein